MKKKILLLITLFLFVGAILFLFLKEDSFEKKMDQLNTNMHSYTLQGEMDITKGEDVKKYALEVGYLKQEKEDYFKVSITDKELNQTQVILRNKDGVYVLTPTLNQIFKFEGDWPLNSLKPYLIQSINEILKNETCSIEKKEDKYIAKSEVVYPNNVNFKVQNMIFDENALIEELTIYDANKVQQLYIKFNDVNYNAKMKKTYFDLPNKMDAKVGASYVDEAQMPLYPVQVFDSTLKNVRSLEVVNGIKHVLEYEGDRNFTLIESIPKANSEMETLVIGKELLDDLNMFGFYDGNHMQMMHEGIEYTIYSEELLPEEMMRILKSMQVVVMK